MGTGSAGRFSSKSLTDAFATSAAVRPTVSPHAQHLTSHPADDFAGAGRVVFFFLHTPPYTQNGNTSHTLHPRKVTDGHTGLS